MDIKEVVVLRFIDFLIKKPQVSGANIEIKENEKLVEEIHNQLLENLKKEKYVHPLKKIFGVLI